jgi:tRNA(Leu) C34 or U34 (ribose-2'-O)-methylase TrmL
VSRGYAAIGLYAPKFDANVGGALRAAQCYGAALLVVEGPRTRRVATDTTATARHIPTLYGGLLAHIPEGCVPVAVEIGPDTRPLPSYAHPESAYYLFGPEDGSLPDAVVRACRDRVSIPTHYCMNLASTVNVVLYDRLAKLGRGAR